jgi:hypothetical protein
MPKFVCNHSRTFRRRRSEASKQTIDILKDRHIGNGFKVDEAAADRVLAYLRQLAAGKPDDDDRAAIASGRCFPSAFGM